MEVSQEVDIVEFYKKVYDRLDLAVVMCQVDEEGYEELTYVDVTVNNLKLLRKLLGM